MSEFGAGGANFLLDEVECVGTESSLSECPHDPWRTHDCRPYEVAGVVCRVSKGARKVSFPRWKFESDHGSGNAVVPVTSVHGGNQFTISCRMYEDKLFVI